LTLQQVGSPATDVDSWIQPAQPSRPARIFGGLWKFARRKPLGALCGLVIIAFMIVGDLVPTTTNKITWVAGMGEPVPYLADQMVETFPFLYDYSYQDLRARLQGPSSSHLLGTDQLGRDILSRILYGARTAVMVSFGAVLISSVLNVLISVPAGFYGGWYDKLSYRFVDVADALPTLVILIVVLGIFGSGLWPMIISIGIVQGLGGRTLRGQTIAIMQSSYIEGAKSIGAGDLRIIAKHVIPNIMHLIILLATIRLGGIVLLEASLSFLGYGIMPPFPSWGQMLSLDGRQYMAHAPGLAIYPGLAIALLVFSFNLFGDALRDVMDPRLRTRAR
jgi:peptide/nickel transport system permease protein